MKFILTENATDVTAELTNSLKSNAKFVEKLRNTIQEACAETACKKHSINTRIKGFNVKKYHNISLEVRKEVTKNCVICGFDKVVDLHHIDHNRIIFSRKNLIGLCPNHHKMIHDIRFSDEIKSQLAKII